MPGIAEQTAKRLMNIGPYKRLNTWRFKINQQLRSIRTWKQGLQSDWEGTYWKDKIQVQKDLHQMEGELNILYDVLDELTDKKNERTML